MATGASFFITTPIFYVNDVPHIGHGYTEVAADVLARWHRQRGDDTFLLTGTDEHGQKILRTATEHGVTPKEWADRLVEDAWHPLLRTLDIANDDFIRTTQPRHEAGVRRFVQDLYDKGYIYPGEFEGYYCVGCEEYKQESDLVEGTGEFAGQRVCAIHSKPVELLKERNYFFKLSEFTQPLLDLYERQPDFIRPDSARNEVVQFVRQGLTDLSISRSSFDWGIKLPWDPAHVLYVWVDALMNYATAVGYGDDAAAFARRWPPQMHLVGKDILRFHAVIWPALLMAAGLPLPEHVFGHGWLLVGGEKMSKSKLTGIAPTQITDVFGSDAFRYYFMRAISFGHDGSFSWEDIAARYEAELANGFGNLASRVLAMIVKYFDGTVPEAGEVTPADRVVLDLVGQAPAAADARFLDFDINGGAAEIWRLVDVLNGYITEQEPWAVAKTGDIARLGTILNTAWRGIGALAVLLSPIIPKACATLWSVLGEGDVRDVTITAADRWTERARPVVHTIAPLFPRVDASEVPATPVPRHQA
jgi:methionyl-tRNA synthetase